MSITLKKNSLFVKDGGEYKDIAVFSAPQAVEKWLDNHPEATTTVQDNSLTTAKYQDESITTQKLADETLKLYSLHLSDQEEVGDMTLLVFPNNKVICCDTGFSGQESAIDIFMSTRGIFHIDILITTHFHSDHTGCFRHVVETYCDENTTFYRGMDWDITKIPYSRLSPSDYESIISKIGAQSIIPTQNQIILPWEKCQIRFLNTDTNFLSGYYTAKSDTNSASYVNPTVNNLSLITEITWLNKKILLCGDIERLAQENNANYINTVDILKIPHHNWNYNGYYKFFLNANPKIAFFNRNTEMTFFGSAPHYWDKIQIQMMGDRPTYQTLTQNVEIHIDNFSIKVISGDTFTYSGTVKSNDTRMLNFIPNCKSDYDFWEQKIWGIEDVLSMISESNYLLDSLIDLRSTTIMPTFIEQLKDVIGTQYNVYSVCPFKNGFELMPTTAPQIVHRFIYGFIYADSSTYASRYKKNEFNSPTLSRSGIANTNMIDYATTLPQGVHFRTMNNFIDSDFPALGNYWVTFYVTNSNYITIEAMSVSSPSKYLRQMKNGIWDDWKVITYNTM